MALSPLGILLNSTVRLGFDKLVDQTIAHLQSDPSEADFIRALTDLRRTGNQRETSKDTERSILILELMVEELVFPFYDGSTFNSGPAAVNFYPSSRALTTRVDPNFYLARFLGTGLAQLSSIFGLSIAHTRFPALFKRILFEQDNNHTLIGVATSVGNSLISPEERELVLNSMARIKSPVKRLSRWADVMIVAANSRLGPLSFFLDSLGLSCEALPPVPHRGQDAAQPPESRSVLRYRGRQPREAFLRGISLKSTSEWQHRNVHSPTLHSRGITLPALALYLKKSVLQTQATFNRCVFDENEPSRGATDVRLRNSDAFSQIERLFSESMPKYTIDEDYKIPLATAEEYLKDRSSFTQTERQDVEEPQCTCGDPGCRYNKPKQKVKLVSVAKKATAVKTGLGGMRTYALVRVYPRDMKAFQSQDLWIHFQAMPQFLPAFFLRCFLEAELLGKLDNWRNVCFGLVNLVQDKERGRYWSVPFFDYDGDKAYEMARKDIAKLQSKFKLTYADIFTTKNGVHVYFFQDAVRPEAYREMLEASRCCEGFKRKAFKSGNFSACLRQSAKYTEFDIAFKHRIEPKKAELPFRHNWFSELVHKLVEMGQECGTHVASLTPKWSPFVEDETEWEPPTQEAKEELYDGEEPYEEEVILTKEGSGSAEIGGDIYRSKRETVMQRSLEYKQSKHRNKRKSLWNTEAKGTNLPYQPYYGSWSTPEKGKMRTVGAVSGRLPFDNPGQPAVKTNTSNTATGGSSTLSIPQSRANIKGFAEALDDYLYGRYHPGHSIESATQNPTPEMAADSTAPVQDRGGSIFDMLIKERSFRALPAELKEQIEISLRTGQGIHREGDTLKVKSKRVRSGVVWSRIFSGQSLVTTLRLVVETKRGPSVSRHNLSLSLPPKYRGGRLKLPPEPKYK